MNGLIIDGIAAAELVDTSAEVIDLESMDVSSFERGEGVINWEHQGTDWSISAKKDKEKSPLDIVGKIVYCRKIFKGSDCVNERQRLYWDSVKAPFLYIVGRLFDGAGHAHAQALAAIIRDAVANDEFIITRFSIEGATLEKDGNLLKKCVARALSLTIKPCNKACISGVLADPNAPKGFKTSFDNEDVKDMIEDWNEEKGGFGLYKSIPSIAVFNDPTLAAPPELVKSEPALDLDPLEFTHANARQIKLIKNAVDMIQTVAQESTSFYAPKVITVFAAQHERKYPVGKLVMTQDHCFVASDPYNMLQPCHGDLQTKGPVLANLLKQPFILIEMSDPVFQSKVKRNRPTLFRYKPNGSSKWNKIDISGEKASYNGHAVSHEELKYILAAVGRGEAVLEYVKQPEIPMFKTEVLLGAVAQEETEIHTILDKLREALLQSNGTIQLGNEEFTQEDFDHLRRQVYEDVLIKGMGNKLAYLEFLRRQDRAGVCCAIDANDFRHINNNFGHLAGDMAIVVLGNCIRNAIVGSAVRAKSYRTGGDEFFVHLEDPNAAKLFLQKLQQAMEQTEVIGDDYKLSISVGMGNNPEQAEMALIHGAKKVKETDRQQQTEPTAHAPKQMYVFGLDLISAQ